MFFEPQQGLPAPPLHLFCPLVLLVACGGQGQPGRQSPPTSRPGSLQRDASTSAAAAYSTAPQDASPASEVRSELDGSPTEPRQTTQIVEMPPFEQPPYRCAAPAHAYGLSALCVRGKQTQQGEELAEDSVRFVLTGGPGCFGYHDEVRRDHRCNSSVADDGHYELSYRFCATHVPTRSRNPVPGVCVHVGDATCSPQRVSPGTHRAKAGRLEVEFVVPSVVPQGGLCAVWDRRCPNVTQAEEILFPDKRRLACERERAKLTGR